jgi:hypothetical protein
MEMRIERVCLETDHQLIVGDLHLPREGYLSRLSDYLNRGGDHFVPLSNAEIRPLNGNAAAPERRSFLAVSRDHVTLAYPASERER